jgi:transposase InsO family protein
MTHRPTDERWALFWCRLLEPVLFDDTLEPKDVRATLRQISETDCTFPDGTTRKPSLSTLRRKLKRFGNAGVTALYRQPRSDRGRSRKHDATTIARAVEIKRDQPKRSHEAINRFLVRESKDPIARSTLYRYLRRAGATKLKLDVTTQPVRKRFSRDHTHDLWVGDFAHGPYVLDDGRPVATRLCGWIDCHSRFLIEGRYYYGESFDVLVDSLLRALVVHGLPRALFVDNAKVYHANALKLACYELGIRLLHRRVRDPATGGLIERFIKTAQEQFETEVRSGDILTLDQLNRAFNAWLSVSYHTRKHSETDEAPKARYDQGLRVRRTVDVARALRFFLERESRRVHKDFADVQVKGAFFRVDRKLRGDKVEVRYDPFTKRLDEVFVYAADGVYLGKGKRHDREHGETVMPADRPKAKEDYLGLLVDEHDRALARATGGIDYRKAAAQHPFPFNALLTALSELLGRKGGVSAFSADEHEALAKLYQRHPGLDRQAVLDAFERAHPKTLVGFAQAIPVVLRTRKERS